MQQVRSLEVGASRGSMGCMKKRKPDEPPIQRPWQVLKAECVVGYALLRVERADTHTKERWRFSVVELYGHVRDNLPGRSRMAAASVRGHAPKFEDACEMAEVSAKAINKERAKRKEKFGS